MGHTEAYFKSSCIKYQWLLCPESFDCSESCSKEIAPACVYPARVVAVIPSKCGAVASGALRCEGALRQDRRGPIIRGNANVNPLEEESANVKVFDRL